MPFDRMVMKNAPITAELHSAAAAAEADAADDRGCYSLQGQSAAEVGFARSDARGQHQRAGGGQQTRR